MIGWQLLTASAESRQRLFAVSIDISALSGFWVTVLGSERKP